MHQRPHPFDGALVDPKWRRFEQADLTERLLHSTVAAISASEMVASSNMPCKRPSAAATVKPFDEVGLMSLVKIFINQDPIDAFSHHSGRVLSSSSLCIDEA
jgi:hypothetical protein